MSAASLEECLEELLDIPADEVASAWKPSHPGGEVVGCSPPYTPVELGLQRLQERLESANIKEETLT